MARTKESTGVESADNWQAQRLSLKEYTDCRHLNARFEGNDILIFIYSHYPFDQNAKSSDTEYFTLSIKCFCILIPSDSLYTEITMSLHSNHAFRYLQCTIQQNEAAMSCCCQTTMGIIYPLSLPNYGEDQSSCPPMFWRSLG